jgi:hypothetical protein
MILKQATIYARKFLMVLSSDSKTGATGKTVTVKLSKGPGPVGGTTAAGTVTELDATNNPGVYQVLLTAGDTSALGDLWYTCSASLCDNTDFVDQVQSFVFSDLNIDASGNVSIASNIKKNQATTISFLMTNLITGAPMTGLTVTCQRAFPPAGFAPCTTPTATEMSNGSYSEPLAATDTNASVIMFRATAPGANDQNILLYTQP